MAVIAAPPSSTHELPHARFTSLATPSRGSSETAMWRVQISPGTAPTPHSLTREEVFYVLAGRARVELAGETEEAGPGDVIIVPKDTEFALSNAHDEPLELLCCMPVGGQARIGDKTFTPPWAE